MTKQINLELSIDEAIEIAEKIISYGIDDNINEKERYTREHLCLLALPLLDWEYLTKVKNPSQLMCWIVSKIERFLLKLPRKVRRGLCMVEKLRLF